MRRLFDLGSDPPCGASRITKPTAFIFIVLLDWLLHRCGACVKRLAVGRIYVSHIDVNVARHGWPALHTVAEHDNGIVNAHFGMSQLSALTGVATQTLSTEYLDQEVHGSGCAVDDQIRCD